MFYKLLTSKEQPVFKWKGGITKQFFVYPEGSEGVGSGSLLEVTSSTMDFPETEYTLFDGYKRILMVIDGSTELSHVDGTSKKLEKYDYHSFHGSTQTYSRGLATDYEIIFADSLDGSMQVLSGENIELPININDKKLYLGFYCDGEKASVTIDENCFDLTDGDHLSIILETGCSIKVKTVNSVVINSKIAL
ncbi:MAG: HutD family protein [Firmicutes bacterium]|nr:HutD family protein [Bacillota bacterium]